MSRVVVALPPVPAVESAAAREERLRGNSAWLARLQAIVDGTPPPPRPPAAARPRLVALALVVALAVGCPAAWQGTLDTAAEVERTAGAAISAGCQAAYGRAKTAEEIAAASRVCVPALDAYDAHEAARKVLAALVAGGASDAEVAAAAARLAAAAARLTETVGRVR